MVTEADAGITVARCRPDGTVAELLVNELGVDEAAPLFTAWCSHATIGTGLALVREASFGQLLVPIRLQFVDQAGAVHDVSAIGAPDTDTTIIVAAVRRSALRHAVQNLMGRVAPTVLEQLAHQVQRDDLGGSASPAIDATDELEPALDALSRTNNELMDLHRALVAANVRLTEQEHTRERMLAMVAHDLRSPLGVMQAMASTLLVRFGDQLDPQARQLVERIANTGERAIELVTELVDGARSLNTELAIQRSQHDLVPLIAEVIDRYRQAATDKQIVLTFDHPPEPVAVPVDDDRIVQALDNLVSNAVKFTPPNVGKSVTVTLTSGEDEVTIAVADEGPGLTDNDLQTVWQPFARASARPTAGEASTGLGLPIAQRIVEAHRGRIDATSTPDAGAVFTVYLPVSRSDDTRRPRAESHGQVTSTSG